jgi:outer membrane receptor protein involved in Fe transport
MRTQIKCLLTSLTLTGVTVSHGAEPEPLDVVVVTATRADENLEKVPAAVTVRTPEEIRANGFIYATDEFRGVPGVFFRRGEGDGDEFPFVSFRGSTGTEGSLSLIDGIPIVSVYEELQLNELPYEALDRIEIVKGPVSALYGRGALYGAINYVTSKPTTNSGRVGFTGGSDSYYRVAGSLQRTLTDRTGLTLAGTLESDDGWRDGSARELRSVFTKLDHELTDRTTIAGYFNFSHRDVLVPNAIPLAGDGRIFDVVGGREAFFGFGDPNNESEYILGAVVLRHEFSDAFTGTFTAHARRFERESFLNFFDPFGTDLERNVVGFNGFSGDIDQRVRLVDAAFSWRLGRHSLVFGASAERATVDDTNRWTGQNGFTFECGFTFFLIELDARSGEVLNRDNPCFETNSLLTDASFTNTFWGAYLQDEIAISDQWRLTIGGRYDSFERKANFSPVAGVTDGGPQSGEADSFSPKATLSFLPAWGQVYLAYGRGFNSNFGATFEWDPVQYARPEARPTTIDSVELGVKGRALGNRLRFEAAAFRTQQKNRRIGLPNPAAEVDPTAPFNLITFGDRLDSQGIEASLNLAPRDGTTLKLNYTYIDAEWDEFVLQTFGGPRDLSGNRPTGVPENIFYAELGQRITPWLTVRAQYEAYDDYAISQDNQFVDGAYQLLTVGAQIQPQNARNLSFDVVVSNALDREAYFYFGRSFAPNYVTPIPPRQLRATFNLRF